jgi:hypothetical protein
VGTRSVLLACVLVLVAAGCGTGDRERDVAAVAERFHAALQAEDGRAACRELSEKTALKLEQDEERPCEEAIFELELPAGGTVSYARVEVTSGFASLGEGGSDFLEEGPDGWKVSAAGCDPTAPDQPYECELES